MAGVGGYAAGAKDGADDALDGDPLGIELVGGDLIEAVQGCGRQGRMAQEAEASVEEDGVDVAGAGNGVDGDNIARAEGHGRLVAEVDEDAAGGVHEEHGAEDRVVEGDLSAGEVNGVAVGSLLLGKGVRGGNGVENGVGALGAQGRREGEGEQGQDGCREAETRRSGQGRVLTARPP